MPAWLEANAHAGFHSFCSPEARRLDLFMDLPNWWTRAPRRRVSVKMRARIVVALLLHRLADLLHFTHET
jgi:hypothetical protein